MKQTQNQFHGKDDEKSAVINATSPAGTTFFATDTNKMYVSGKLGVEEVGRSSSPSSFIGKVDVTHKITENAENNVIFADVTLDGSDTASNTSWMRAGRFNITNVSTTDQQQITGMRGNATHSATGDITHVVGGDSRAYSSGAGDSENVTGQFVFSYLSGTNTTDFLIGTNTNTALAVGTSNNLIGINSSVKMYSGKVIEYANVAYLTFSQSGGTIGTNSVNAEFNYLKIGSDVPTTMFGNAYAINCLADLPSKFAGTLSAKTLSTTGYTVANLPAGVIGDRAYATDLTAPTHCGPAIGGGSVICPVFHNGTEWISA